MIKKVTTWVVVADGTRARVLENAGPGLGLAEVPGGTFEGPNRRDGEIASDRPGRSFDSRGQGRHAMEPDTPAARHEHREFARSVAAWLNEPKRRDRYDRLAVVAAPRTLGDLRELLPAGVRAKVVCELDKDLVAAKPAAIVDALGDRIAL